MRSRVQFIILYSLLFSFSTFAQDATASREVNNKVFMHYMAWYGAGEDGNHWKDGTAQEPIIGFYNSQSWSTHLYHILISSALGVDGMVVNVRTDYDEASLKMLFPSLQRIVDVDADFNYQIAVSYDDQDMTIESVKEELAVLRDDIIGTTDHYLHAGDDPVIFIWNYDGFLSSEDYREAVSATFPTKNAVLLRNEIDFNTTKEAIDSYYPWVQGFDDEGTNWGEGYLDWYYRTLQIREDIAFSTGGVWAGFDDRAASWGQNRWIDRKDGETLQQTWDLIHKYQEESAIKWVILETWNDWNEGTELEPSKEHGFAYATKSAENIAAFKDTTYVVNDSLFSAATKLYFAAEMIETGERDSATFYGFLQDAIGSFIDRDAKGALTSLDQIINPVVALASSQELVVPEIYPNPSFGLVNIPLPNEKAEVTIHDFAGKKVYTQVVDPAQKAIQWNASGAQGLYLIEITTQTQKSVQRLIVQ
ncbi:T9SS type A sorting domain-containing protein [Marinoscillum furvescens]|uniref:Putative secreted protein (Por secretion system target) n=1 Tax=Marinoscillum furvescens DSM 4134 TaxID=1122208 RepID=A0A3D9L586_MARFU|nr:T9SS type A sorting domain-containing protein [Marinoscillum furvescens]RED98387.1 putative secreted protein (Por secretion system target) [Marinoscillum furvescens DSM 4134]